MLADWNLESYSVSSSAMSWLIFLRSSVRPWLTTAICLFFCLSVRLLHRHPGAEDAQLLLILVMIPFWSNFLVRTYAWRVLLGSDGPLSQLSEAGR